VDADPKEHAALVRQRRRLDLECVLDRERGLDRPCRRTEDGENGVAGRVDDPSLVALDLFAKDGASLVQRRDGRSIVGGHQAGVRSRVSGQDCREPLPECLTTHRVTPPRNPDDRRRRGRIICRYGERVHRGCTPGAPRSSWKRAPNDGDG